MNNIYINKAFRAVVNTLCLISIPIYIALLWAPTKSYGGELNIERLEMLPRNDVCDTYEDRRGFIWIATLDGLYRYDGYECRAFLPDKSDKSISSSMIMVINEDSRGNIWLGTNGRGLSMYDPYSGHFRNYSLLDIYGTKNHHHDITSLEIDRQNNIWIGTVRGFGRLVLDPKSYDITAYYDYTDTIMIDNNDPNTVVTKIFEDQSGNIWVGSSSAIIRIVDIDGDSINADRYEIPCFDICDYTANAILVGGNGITPIEMNMESGHYQIGEQISPRYTETIHLSQGKIWSGNRRGLLQLSREDESMSWRENTRITAYENSALESNIISSIMSSKSDQIWVATLGGGLHVIDTKSRPFFNYPTTDSRHAISQSIKKAIYEDSHGNIWIGTDGRGVDFVAAGGDYTSGSRHIEVNREDDRVYSLHESGADGEGRNIMWMGVPPPRFLSAIDINTMERIKQSPLIPKLGFILTFAQSDSSTLWAGSHNNGLWRLTIDKHGEIVKWKHFMARHDELTYGLNSNSIRYLFIDSRGDLWITTDVGTNRVDRDDLLSEEPQFNKCLSKWGNSCLTGHYILQIMESSSGDLYFGSMGSGLMRYTPSTDHLQIINSDNGGLINNTTKSIVEDIQSGAIWVATNAGLSKYTPSNGSVTNYGREHRILDIEFSEICGILRSNGLMAFGNRRGVVEFDPQKIPTSKVTPTLLFTDLTVNNRRITVDAQDHILSRSIEFTNSIELDYEERNFTINFVGINLASPQGSKYRYRLHGFDREWSSISGDKRWASYTNIPAGRYTFSVQASNADDVWSERMLDMQILIHPPLHRSGLAYMLYMLLFVCAGYFIFWVTRLRYLKRRDIDVAKMEQHRIEELMQYKLDFFMNVSHEFRTPLTLISIPLDKSKEVAKQIGNTALKESLDLIGRNVAVLKQLINELLDFRKVEEGKQPIKVEPCDIGSFTKLYYDLFALTAERRSIAFNILAPSERLVVDLDKRLFEKVITNLLSNAFRHTPDSGAIEISIKLNKELDIVTISVVDNGCGVEQDSLCHIFDQFYQAENSNSGGSGIGLSICKGIVELHGGLLRAESEINNGFRATIELPRSHKTVVEEQSHAIIDTESVEEFYKRVEQSDAEDDQPDLQPIIHNDGSRSKILIVEDNNDLRRELVNTLGRDYTMFEAENGEQGIAQCHKHYPDLIITDIMMPVMDGIEMCRNIKENEDISHTPIMVLTANSSVKSQIDSFTIGGAEGYLDKPFDIKILRSHVKAILHNRSLLQNRFQRQSIITPDAVAQTPADVKFLTQIISIIKDDIGNSELNVELIAQRYGVSRTYLNRKIKALTGDTSIIFLRRIKLKYAASLLTQGELNVNEVAWEVGYNDINTFRLRFKEMYGVSPTNYKGEEQRL